MTTRKAPLAAVVLLALLLVGWLSRDAVQGPGGHAGRDAAEERSTPAPLAALRGRPGPETDAAPPGPAPASAGVATSSGPAVVAREADRDGATDDAPQGAPAFVARVVVRDARGAPVPGVRVVVHDTEHRWSWVERHGRILADGHTDDEGRFAAPIRGVAPPEAWVYVRPGPGYWKPPRGRKVTDATPAVEITLPAARVVEGVVLDARGEPAPGVRVRARWRSVPGGAQLHRAKASTDVTGRFALQVMAGARDGWIWARTTNTPDRNEGAPAVMEVLSCRARLPSSAGVFVTLRPDPDRGALAGRLVDAEGRPVRHARLALRSRTDELLAGTLFVSLHGTHRFRVEGLLPGRYALDVEVGGHPDEHPSDALPPVDVKDLAVDVPGRDLVVRCPPRYAPLEGRVVGPRSERVHVEWHDPKETGVGWSTGVQEDGSFDIPTDEPGAVLWIRDEETNRYALVEDLQPPYDPLEVELQAGHRIEGMVEPASAPRLERRYLRLTRGPLTLVVFVASDGTFAAKGLPPGEWELAVGDDRAGTRQATRTVRAGTRGLVVRWPEAASVEGR